MGHEPKSGSFLVMDRIVTPQEHVTKKEVGLTLTHSEPQETSRLRIFMTIFIRLPIKVKIVELLLTLIM